MYEDPYPYHSGYGASHYLPPKPSNAGMAVGGMVLGIVTAVLAFAGCFPFVGAVTLLSGIPAIACSWYALNEIRNSQGAVGGSGMAIAGIVTGAVGILFGLLTVAFYTYIVVYEM